MKGFASPVEKFKESIFATMSRLAYQHKAINLSQGFPDFEAPTWILDAAKEAMDKGFNQYAPGNGVPELREAIANHLNNHYDLNYDAFTEITITNGATEAIFSTAMALLNPGDEVIVFEPFYDSYEASILLKEAKIVPVTLKAPDFSFDKKELEEAFSEKTKMIFFNSPHNPSGKVFSKEELEFISNLAIKHDVYVLSDEVYEHLTFEKPHIPIATLDGMKERTITISSAGKTYSLTGWKIGWCASSEKISQAIRLVHQYNTFSVSHPFQYAVAHALRNSEEYLLKFKKDYKNKRDLLVKGLKEAGLKPINPEGTYFILCEVENDVKDCQDFIEKYKVASIPCSAFYLKSNEGKKLIRFCFAKKDETLNEAISNLKKRNS